MKRIKLLVGLLVALMILGGISAPTASAQMLHGKWFKASVNFQGGVVDADTGAFTKQNSKQTIYLHFDYNVDGYVFYVYTEVSPGSWDYRYIGNVQPFPHPNGSVGPETGLDWLWAKVYVGATNDFYEFDVMPLLQNKNNGQIQVKQATGIAYGSFGSNESRYFGSSKFKMQSVDAPPFTP